MLHIGTYRCYPLLKRWQHSTKHADALLDKNEKYVVAC